MNHLATPFRPFFIAAGLAAAFLVPQWLLIIGGHISLSSPLGPSLWHAHEMIFGFIGAVLAGFLLTATVNWTGNKTVGGAGLAMLFSLWLLARIVHSTSLEFPGSQWIEVVFFAGVAAAIGRAIVVARRWRNLSFPLLIALMGGCDLLLHFSATDNVDPKWVARAIWLSLDAAALIILIFGGRVLPLFTKNALGLSETRSKGVLDYAGIFALLLLMGAHALQIASRAEGVLWSIAGLLTIARLYGWGGSKTWKTPLLWVLHLGWLLTGLGMLLVAYSLYYPLSIAPSSAQHLLFVGGIGTLTLGMMVRVSLGHTGREKIASRPASIAFVLIVLAAVARVLAALFEGEFYLSVLYVAGSAWSLSFLLFLYVFVPVLLYPRADGKPG